jgi:hypothetical protein
VFLLYERELAHKVAYLRARVRGGSSEPGELAPLRRFVTVAALLLASFAVAEAAARWAGSYDCAAIA